MLKCEEASGKRKEDEMYLVYVFFQASRGNLNFRSKNSKEGDKEQKKAWNQEQEIFPLNLFRIIFTSHTFFLQIFQSKPQTNL